MPIFFNKNEKVNNFFKSSLANYLFLFFQFMQSHGYAYKSNLSWLKKFDQFLIDKRISSPQKINQAVIISWINENYNLNPATKNIMLSVVRAFFKYLQRIEVIKFNPAEGIAPFKEKKYLPYIYTIEQISKILEEARSMFRNSSYNNLVHYTIIYLLYALGLRISEALNIRIKDINFNQKTLFIFCGKFSKERLIPFSEKVKEKLESFLKIRQTKYPLQNEEEPLFLSNKTKRGYTREAIETNFRRITHKLGLVIKEKNPPRLHDIRHTFAVHRLYKWYNEGADVLNKLPLLSKVLGHVNIEATQIYITISNALLKEANKRFQEKFGDINLKGIKK